MSAGREPMIWTPRADPTDENNDEEREDGLAAGIDWRPDEGRGGTAPEAAEHGTA